MAQERASTPPLKWYGLARTPDKHSGAIDRCTGSDQSSDRLFWEMRSDQSHSPPKRVLLVEDSIDWQDILARVVQSCTGLHLAGTIDNAAGAIAAAKERSLHAVVLDLHLREGSGHDVLAAIKNTQPGCVVIVVTVSDSPEDRRRSLTGGADHFLLKHRDIGTLREVLAAISASRSG